MAVTWSTTQNEIGARGVKMLVYGKAGVGKTALTATAPRPLIISRESGLLSLDADNIERIWKDTKMPYVTDIPVMKIETQEDCEYALKVCQDPSTKERFDTAVIDSLSEIAENILEKAKNDPKCKDGRQAYMKTQEFIIKWVKDMRDIEGLNIVFICKQEHYKDEITGVLKQGPMMPGQKTGIALPYLFDIVLFYGVDARDQKNIHRFVQTQPDLQIEAKDRSGKLQTVEYPHLGYLINKIKG
ncbi:hypothetical protein [Vibrio phage vB_VibM_83AMN]|nr:hypothetical protein [Vibrio phage vB_VibM_83AMN]